MPRAARVLGLVLLGLCACPSRSQPQEQADNTSPDPYANFIGPRQRGQTMTSTANTRLSK